MNVISIVFVHILLKLMHQLAIDCYDEKTLYITFYGISFFNWAAHIMWYTVINSASNGTQVPSCDMIWSFNWTSSWLPRFYLPFQVNLVRLSLFSLYVNYHSVRKMPMYGVHNLLFRWMLINMLPFRITEILSSIHDYKFNMAN